jgi:hypothetical protein
VSEPTQKPGRSRQDYGTPPEFLAAVKAYLDIDAFAFDFACTPENAVAANYFHGDALAMDWVAALGCSLAWGFLNPPFADIGPWVRKAYEAGKGGRHIAVLIPAYVGSRWWGEWVNHKADVLFLQGRLTFLGTPPNPKTGKPDPFPKDCALLLYSAAAYACHGSYDVWDWRREPSRAVDAEIPMSNTGNAIGCAPALFSSIAEAR